MPSFHKKNKIKNIVYLYSILAVFVVLIFLLGNATWNMYNGSRVAKMKMAQTASELDSLRDREAHIASSLDYIKTQSGIESELRKRFPVVKDGERVIVIVDDGNEREEDVSPENKKGVWDKVKDFFTWGDD